MVAVSNSQHLAGGKGDVAVGDYRHFIGVGGFRFRAGRLTAMTSATYAFDGLAEHGLLDLPSPLT